MINTFPQVARYTIQGMGAIHATALGCMVLRNKHNNVKEKVRGVAFSALVGIASFYAGLGVSSLLSGLILGKYVGGFLNFAVSSFAYKILAQIAGRFVSPNRPWGY